MDAWGFDNVRSEKANAVLRYNRVQSVAKLFRLVEICSVLVILIWISARLPFALRISVDYLRQLISLIASPIFVFFAGNLIVLTLRLKSGKFWGNQTPASVYGGPDLTEEIASRYRNDVAPVPEEIVCREKEEVVIAAESVAPKFKEASVRRREDVKSLRRSQSENLKREKSEKTCRKLYRSETEKFCDEEREEMVEELSSEDFQRTVEEFIAKQVKFRREEKLIIVPYTGN